MGITNNLARKLNLQAEKFPTLAKKSFHISEYFEWGQTYWFIEHLTSNKRMHRRWLNKLLRWSMEQGLKVKTCQIQIQNMSRTYNKFNPICLSYDIRYSRALVPLPPKRGRGPRGIEDDNLIHHDNTFSDRDIQTAWLLILPPTLVAANILFRRRTKSLLDLPLISAGIGWGPI